MTEETQRLANLALTAAGGDKALAAARMRLHASQYRMFADAARADGRNGSAKVYGGAADVREAAADSIGD